MSSEETEIDWLKCIFCQKNSNETIQCPAQLTHSDVEKGAGYEAFTTNLERFIELDELPMELDVSHLDDGAGIAQTLLKNRAKWHKSCRNKYV